MAVRRLAIRPMGWVECEDFTVLKRADYERSGVKLRFMHLYLDTADGRIYYIYERNYNKIHMADVGDMSRKAFDALVWLLGDKYYDCLVAANNGWRKNHG